MKKIQQLLGVVLMLALFGVGFVAEAQTRRGDWRTINTIKRLETQTDRSHGCVRVMRQDIFALSEKIATARNLTDAKNKISAARNDSERRVFDLNTPVSVDINYDTIIVEGGTLYIYPDVYERKSKTLENLRAELESYGVDIARIEEKTLREMIDKPSDEQYFAVSLADIKAGKIMENGKTEPLTPQQK